jgi:F-type H+-transporting ATPase subunit gamma
VASTQDLKRRVRSITNTRKVTRAMELVASARLRRAQQRIEAMRPYADRMLELMAGVSKAAGAVRLPLLERREQIAKVAILPVTADRGLAGGFNAQVIRRSLALMREQEAEGREVVWFSTGRKASSTLRFRRLNLVQGWTGFSERPAYSDAQAIAHAVSEAYTSGEVDTVFVVYNAFVSALTQTVTVRELLPIPTEDISRFQDELREHLRAQKEIYAQVRDQGDLSDDKAESLNAEIEKVKSRFATSEDQAA